MPDPFDFDSPIGTRRVDRFLLDRPHPVETGCAVVVQGLARRETGRERPHLRGARSGQGPPRSGSHRTTSRRPAHGPGFPGSDRRTAPPSDSGPLSWTKDVPLEAAKSQTSHRETGRARPRTLIVFNIEPSVARGSDGDGTARRPGFDGTAWLATTPPARGYVAAWRSRRAGRTVEPGRERPGRPRGAGTGGSESEPGRARKNEKPGAIRPAPRRPAAVGRGPGPRPARRSERAGSVVAAEG
jgi:hypothetical protein